MTPDLFHDVNATLIADLRALRDGGAPWMDVVRLAAGREPVPWRVMLAMRAAFGFEGGDVSCLGGWSADGSGELSDARIEELLARAAKRRRAL